MSNKMALDARGDIRKDMPSSAYKMGDEFKPFHPGASHVRPEWRDGWNACFIAAIAALQAEPQPAPVHPNHRADLRYVRKVLDDVRSLALTEGDKLCGDVDAAINGMDYIIKRTEEAACIPATPPKD